MPSQSSEYAPVERRTLRTLFAAHHPERCDGLILYGAFAQFRYWFPDASSLQGLFDYIESDWGSGNSLPGFAPSVADDPAYREWWGRFERLGATPGAAIALMKMNSQIDILDVLPSVHVPTLVIHRANDVLIDVAAGRELAGHIPGARYCELAGEDHLPWVANSDEIIAAVESFVRAEPEESPDRVLATVVLIRPGKSGPDAGSREQALIRGEAARFRATRIEPLAEGIAVSFDGPSRALQCALAISSGLQNAGTASQIGIHTGEVGRRSGAAGTVAVRVAADVCSHARDGEVLLTRTIRDLVAGSDVPPRDRGQLSLQALGEDWQLFAAARD